MFVNILNKFFGTRNARLIKKMMRSVERINALEPATAALSDEQLAAKTVEFRARLEKGETLDQLLPEAFAVVREASKRALGMRHFDVQLIGGMVLHEGKIAEMRTGEGKTLVATLAVYLNALPGKGAHVVTVNDYLARRDAAWMGKVYNFLGLTVGVVVPGQDRETKRAAYAADITYGTNNEYGFDYLRDNMAFRAEDRMQRGVNFAVVDEVDSILIDEARTPLIISGPTEDHTDLYHKINAIVPKLTRQEKEDGPGDYSLDEKARQVHLTEQGHETVERLLGEAGLLGENGNLYDVANILLLHHMNAGLRAHALFKRDVDYVVKNGEIVIVDEFTGRMMTGRRWSDGLHQAVEAKEGVKIQNENQTLASITFQNYFRLYKKLSGMTGTADTEAYEFQEIYGLEVVVIPTHRDMIRDDRGDQVFRTMKEKDAAILADIADCRKRGQPVLVGTASIEASEHLAALLKKDKIPHEVLNAKQHEREAHIVAQAGRPGAVTIATNMAGRGTDIVLGGNLEMELQALKDDDVVRTKAREAWQQRHAEVVAAGGLHVVGTERHESRRIDNQLRGRSGRQGDPGSSRFYLSLEDNLLRIFGSERVSGLMQKLGLQEGEAIEHPWVTRAIENAQRKVEGRNFDIRKQLLEFDDVANDQRKVVYEQRNRLLDAEEVAEGVQAIRRDVIESLVNFHIPPESLAEQWNVPGLEDTLDKEFGVGVPLAEWLAKEPNLAIETIKSRIVESFEKAHAEKSAAVGEQVMRHFEKAVMLQVLDQQWKDHLAAMDYLRQGIHLRGYAQKNPKQEYKREAFEMFSEMLDRIKREVVSIISRVQIRREEEVEAMEAERQRRADQQAVHYEHPVAPGETEVAGEADAETLAATGTEGRAVVQPVVRGQPKIGRNDPCPCGSGKKYKQCHGKLA